MNRGLKAPTLSCLRCRVVVTFTSPMNRGLKATIGRAGRKPSSRLHLLPRWIGDWKVDLLPNHVAGLLLVTFTSPMNRGLKVCIRTNQYLWSLLLHLLPRWIGDWKTCSSVSALVSDGVTFTSPMNRGLKVRTSCNRSYSQVALHLLPRWIGDWKKSVLNHDKHRRGKVTFTSPMNRGLKGSRDRWGLLR